MARIQSGAARRLLLVQAPAGYGKTTVIGEAARRLKWRAAWYKLDMLDQDPLVFVASLAESIRRVVPGFGSILADRLADLHDAPLSTEELLGILASEINDEVEGPLHIVLDDYHESANSPALNAAADYLLASVPSDVHFVVLTRYEPAFQLSRLRLAEEVAVVDRDALRFSARQAAAFLRRRGMSERDAASLDYVLGMTEGWPASLVLISNALASDRHIDESMLAGLLNPSRGCEAVPAPIRRPRLHDAATRRGSRRDRRRREVSAAPHRQLPVHLPHRRGQLPLPPSFSRLS